MKKRIIALLLVICAIITSLSGCAASKKGTQADINESTSAKKTDDTSFMLSFTQADSLDPFKAQTQNNQVLADLVFESLFDIDEGYRVTPDIAKGYEFTSPTTLRVDINTNLKFSDGSAVDVEDILFSTRAAMKSDAYGSALTCISGVDGSDSSIYFYLNYENPFAVNLLTYPISSMNDDENGFPIGSGRYKYALDGEGKTILRAVKNNDFDPYITTIRLVNIAAADSIDNAVNIGNISYAFRDLSADISKRLSCAKKAINMNNLIFIGINSYSGITSDARIRRAISLAADRTVIASSAYSGYAGVAQSMFNPAFKEMESIKILSSEADTATARQTVLQSGYDYSKMDISILVNYNENKVACANLLKTQLESAGFRVTIDKQGYDEYIRRIENAQFDLYIGEVKLGDDMSLYPFFDSEGGTRYGINDEALECDDLYRAYLSGEEELGKFIIAFNEEMPYIPLVYKKGMICYSKALHGDMQGNYSDLFQNIDNWHFDSENTVN